MLDKLVEYLRYPSTYAGLATALTLVGIHFSPEQTQLFATAGASVLAFVLTFFSDSDVKKGKK